MITIRQSKRWIGLALIGLLVVASAAQADISALFGTWQGTATPSYKFTGNNVPYGSPPYSPYSVQLILHSYDLNNNKYGTQSAAGGLNPNEYHLSGIVDSLTEDSGSVTMVTFYPQEGNPNGYSDFVALLSGNTLTGTLNDRSPAGPGFIHEQTTVSLTRVVPEPSSWVVLILGIGTIAAWRFAKRRFWPLVAAE
jgi:hypothetical protein